MKKVKFIKKSLYGKLGEERDCTDRAADVFVRNGIAEFVSKEEKLPAETKEEKAPVETKKVKLTKSPR